MKNNRFSRYIHWGVTAFLVIAACIGLQFFLENLDWVKKWIGVISDILAPIIYGAVMAYLLNPIFNRVRQGTEKAAGTYSGNKNKDFSRLGKFTGTVCSLILLIAVVVGLFSMLLPELINSIDNVIDALPANADRLEVWLNQWVSEYGEAADILMGIYDRAAEQAQSLLYSDILPNMDKIIIGLSTSAYSLVRMVMNILLGLIVMVYLLNMKEVLLAQGKKIVYGVFPLWIANKVVKEVRFIHKVFGGFIIGKLLDSLIIGIICFICMSVMKMPYVLLVSVIIGVTNVIPFFGPFIGAIPSAVLILLVSPMQCLYFLIFILLLQQFDGNILGPKILGDSTGLQSFWVLFSILLFGGLFGFIGMIIAVPTFAVIYKLFAELISNSLKKKGLLTHTEDYDKLNHIDEETKTYKKSRDMDE